MEKAEYIFFYVFAFYNVYEYINFLMNFQIGAKFQRFHGKGWIYIFYVFAFYNVYEYINFLMNSQIRAKFLKILRNQGACSNISFD